MSNKDFDFNFSFEKFEKTLKGINETNTWYELISEVLPRWQIITIPRVAAFMAQTAHESRNYTALEESLYYSEDALSSVFGHYFDGESRKIEDYARKPQKIANLVYSNRMGNGPPESGDGWRYRGRGVIQLTGKNNYMDFADYFDMTLNEAVDYLETKEGALQAACWYWDSRNLNQHADDKDIVRITELINGGHNGLEDRKEKYHNNLKVLNSDYKDMSNLETVRQGSTGETVKRVQEALGITSDGIFGPNTEYYLKFWQFENGLEWDGVAGPKTLDKLLGEP